MTVPWCVVEEASAAAAEPLLLPEASACRPVLSAATLTGLEATCAAVGGALAERGGGGAGARRMGGFRWLLVLQISANTDFPPGFHCYATTQTWAARVNVIGLPVLFGPTLRSLLNAEAKDCCTNVEAGRDCVAVVHSDSLTVCKSYMIDSRMEIDMQLVAEHTLPLLLGIANPQLQECIIVVVPLPWDLLGGPFIQLQQSKALALVTGLGV
ncbi:MAG: hypothetical protein FRX49_10079 [Trebouxia sp. A1-2]|nr:MAG: hypothetical protein FRX49_10079 [Trebouxia sp. A1-2]